MGQKNDELVVMKLQEYQAKQIFQKCEIPIPQGQVALTADFVKEIAEEIGSKVVVKAQVLVGGVGRLVAFA